MRKTPITITASMVLVALAGCGAGDDPAESGGEAAQTSARPDDSAQTSIAPDFTVAYVVRPSLDADSDNLMDDAAAVLEERLTRLGLEDARVTPGEDGTVQLEFVADPGPEVMEQITLPASGRFRPVILAAPPGADRQSSADALQRDSTSEDVGVDQQLITQFLALDCTQPTAERSGALTAADTERMLACSSDGLEKFLLEPVVHAPSASATTTPPDDAGTVWGVSLSLTPDGTEALRTVTERLAPTQSRLAYVTDGLVLSAPSVNAPIPDGQLVVSGFDEQTAQSVALWFRLSGHTLTFEVLETVTP